jgi:TetR/AcrR family transcriptional regulator, repressor of fatR-cypB operon
MVIKDTKLPEKKAAIFTATIKLISENGFHASPISQIAENADVGIGTIYRYFKSKDELINGLFEYVDVLIASAILKGHNKKNSTHDQFYKYCQNIVDFSRNNPDLFVFLNLYTDSSYGTHMRKMVDTKYGDNLLINTFPSPFYQLFTEAKKENLIKYFPNRVLFILVYGSLSHYIKAITNGILEYDKKMEHSVIESCWDMITKNTNTSQNE